MLFKYSTSLNFSFWEIKIFTRIKNSCNKKSRSFKSSYRRKKANIKNIKYFPALKKGIIFLIMLYCIPAIALIEESCFKYNTSFITRYFSALSQPHEVDNFFNDIDSCIHTFLNHTYTKNPKYYTQTEIRRFMQYMGFKKKKALAISQAILKLKSGFIGGHKDRISLTEIHTCRQIFSIFKQKMKAMHSSIPVFLNILDKKNISRRRILQATETMKKNLTGMGKRLSHLSFSSDLSLLEQLPQSIQTLELSNTRLRYWKPALSLLKQWKQVFLTPSLKNTIHSSEWPTLLESFSLMATLWFYHKRFLEDRDWLNVRVIQHTQHFVSYSLNLIRESLKLSDKKYIILHDIDELARRIWFMPYLSQPVFRLGLRSTFCFFLNPLTNNQPCQHSMDFKGRSPDLKISFSDMIFTVTGTKKVHESRLGKNSDRITIAHLDTLRQYLNSWIKSENQLRKTQHLPFLFGSPHRWLNRKINVTSDKRLIFYTEKRDDISFLSHLNWQSHLMKMMTSAYTKREQQVSQKLWNTMIKEWTALSVSFYKDMRWQNFQKLGFQIFKHGDFLTSNSNGDQILQEKEILELFSFFTSSLSAVIAALKTMQHCNTKNPYFLKTPCVQNTLQQFPRELFTSFPRLLESLSQNENKKINYIAQLNSFYRQKQFPYDIKATISLKDLFEIFLFIHYQENTMEYLDRDFSQSLSVRELEPLLNIFETTLIYETPLINTKKEAFAFITYLFHYGEIPIFSHENTIISPVHFSNWLLQPEKWELLEANQTDILRALFLINKRAY